MKLKPFFVLRQVADIWVVLPLGRENLDFSDMLTLNDTGAMLWQLLEKGGDRHTLSAALTEEFEVSQDRAQADVDLFLEKLSQAGCIDLE